MRPMAVPVLVALRGQAPYCSESANDRRFHHFLIRKASEMIETGHSSGVDVFLEIYRFVGWECRSRGEVQGV